MKLRAFKDFVAGKTVPGDVVMMMDASDVLFVGGAQPILDAYQAIGAPIVASAELGCAPQVSPHTHPPCTRATADHSAAGERSSWGSACVRACVCAWVRVGR